MQSSFTSSIFESLFWNKYWEMGKIIMMFSATRFIFYKQMDLFCLGKLKNHSLGVCFAYVFAKQNKSETSKKHKKY